MIVDSSSIAGSEIPLLNRIFAVDGLVDKDMKVNFPLNAGERKILCDHLDLQAIEDWEGTVWLRRTADQEGIVLRVTFAANVIQSCVVTLEPLRNRVQQSFTNLYLPEDRLEGAGEMMDVEFVIDVEDDDFPEVLQEGGIDVGEAIVEQFALALDPYPRTPGVKFRSGTDQEGAAEEKAKNDRNQFAALKSWQSGN